MAVRLSRRDVIKAAAGAGLVLGFRWTSGPRPAGAAQALAPNAFVHIAPDDGVTVIAKHIEFGQGSHTGLATILAEELDADWAQVRVESAPADADRYANLAWAPMAAQGAGGSTAMANSWEQLRKAGATARAMLVEAAAREWRVPAAEITVESGVIGHAASARRARFGELAAQAAALPAPAEVRLKAPGEFRLIGARLPRVDTRAKSDGSAVFTLDLHLPGMLTAVLARPERFGAKPRSFDAAAARAVPGVVDVVAIDSRRRRSGPQHLGGAEGPRGVAR